VKETIKNKGTSRLHTFQRQRGVAKLGCQWPIQLILEEKITHLG